MLPEHINSNFCNEKITKNTEEKLEPGNYSARVCAAQVSQDKNDRWYARLNFMIEDNVRFEGVVVTKFYSLEGEKPQNNRLKQDLDRIKIDEKVLNSSIELSLENSVGKRILINCFQNKEWTNYNIKGLAPDNDLDKEKF